MRNNEIMKRMDHAEKQIMPLACSCPLLCHCLPAGGISFSLSEKIPSFKLFFCFKKNTTSGGVGWVVSNGPASNIARNASSSLASAVGKCCRRTLSHSDWSLFSRMFRPTRGLARGSNTNSHTPPHHTAQYSTTLYTTPHRTTTPMHDKK